MNMTTGDVNGVENRAKNNICNSSSSSSSSISINSNGTNATPAGKVVSKTIGESASDRKTAHFVQLLDNDAPLDMAKLCLEAHSGVPHHLRLAVWPLLLNRTHPYFHRISAAGLVEAPPPRPTQKTHDAFARHHPEFPRSPPSSDIGVSDMSRFAELCAAFDENGPLAQVIRTELRRSTRSVPNARRPWTMERFIGIIGAYIASTNGTQHRKHSDNDVRDMVHITASLLDVFGDDDHSTFDAFSNIMNRIAPFYDAHGLDRAVRDFLMLFKRTLPEVHEIFADADFDVQRWAPSALRSLLLRQLSNNCGHRLIDSLLARSGDDIPSFHIHICIAVLGVMHERDEFLDIEPESLLPRLNNLPQSLPMETIINRATAYKLEREAEGYTPSFLRHE